MTPLRVAQKFLLVAGVISFSALGRAAEPKPLFDGRTLAGWEGDLNTWHVADGAITGGSLDAALPRNVFLATTRSFENFELRLKLKVLGTEGFVNSGVQIRSVRVPASTEMSGYQVDAGAGYWGTLYDESRRNKTIAGEAGPKAGEGFAKAADWNEYRIRAEGPRLRAWINGTLVFDYTETDPAIARDGHIAIQLHGGGKTVVSAKDITIEELPPTPGAPTWAKVGLPAPPPTKK